jgi:3-carboxy-cis,cis-muconate cycloisomerase
MTDLLRTRPATTPAMLALFDDATTLAHALAFETELAKAQATQGLIGNKVAETIARACDECTINPAELANEAALAGTLAIPLVKRLRVALKGDAADALHKGATSQDVADTVLMLQAAEAADLLLTDLNRIAVALATIAERHAGTAAVGRTLLQDALPVGFGLRIAHWYAGIDDAAHRLRIEISTNAKIQFGGAAGTRAGLDGKGAAIAACMAGALGLAPGVPWHSRRGGISAIAVALGIVIGALGKMARDVALLSQNTVGEAREPAVPGRGGSSAMAHKRNPTGCQVALSAAIRAPGLVAGILAGLPAEEERGLGGWQAEGPALSELFLLTAGSADAMATVAEGLEVDEEAIARNLAAAGIGDDIGESVAIVAAILDQHRKDR